jgi:TolA-binding protein
MKSRIEEPSDLLNLARRGPLTRDESRELAAWVDEAPEARVLSDAAEVFDRDSSVLPGDDALITRMAARAAAERQPARKLRRRAPLLLLAAALVLVGSVAAAGSSRVRHGALAMFEYFRGHRASEPAEVVALPTSSNPAAAAQPTEPVAQPVAAVEPPAAADDVTSAEKSEVRPRAAINPSAAASRDPSGAASRDPSEAADKASSLFGRANAKRLAGDDTAAIALYREIAERYPTTPQALMSEMALGKLLMAKGDAAGALSHFRRYASVGGPLGVEALWGEADALRVLGRSTEERHVLEKLLERYPESAYANAARKRLGTP